jgi:hypothetical protein
MAETFEAYRSRVLSYLGDEEPIGVQQATPSQLDRRLRDVAPEELIRRPAPEKWSIGEIVAHLADAELAMGWRLRNMLANPGVALTWWDEAAWAERLDFLGGAQQAARARSRRKTANLCLNKEAAISALTVSPGLSAV